MFMETNDLWIYLRTNKKSKYILLSGALNFLFVPYQVLLKIDQLVKLVRLPGKSGKTCSKISLQISAVFTSFTLLFHNMY